MNTNDRTGPGEADPRLSDADASALDALVEHGGDSTRVSPGLRERAQRIERLLRVLDWGGTVARGGEVDRTLEAVRTAGAAAPRLSGADAEALDAWMFAGQEASHVPASLRARVQRAESIGRAIRGGVPFAREEREGLVSRTLARVRVSIESEQDRFVAPSSRGRFGLRDLLSVAAMLMLGASVLWPAMSSIRESGRRAACLANMRGVGGAFAWYAGDNRDALPMASAGFGGGTWWGVGGGPARSNSANLYALAKGRYVELASLACPGNPLSPTVERSPDDTDWRTIDEISYSYRVMVRPEARHATVSGPVVLLADRSPVILRAVRGELINPFESSPNHHSRGQHGLNSAGSAVWLTSPVLESGDNIWLPRPVERLIDDAVRRSRRLAPLRGTESPADTTDSFVGP